MAAGKGSDLAAVATTGHGTPSAALRARDIVKKQTARRVGASTEARAWALRDNFRRGTCDGGEQPIQTALPGNEFQAPRAIALEKLIVALRNAQDFVDWLDPIPADGLFTEHRVEGFAQRSVKSLRLQKKSGGTLCIVFGEGEQLGAAFRRNDPSGEQKAEELFP